MAKQNLFVPKVKNHVSRNAFDLSHRRIFSSKCGEILPCLVQECLPGDKFKVNVNAFVRTAPLNTAAFARMKQYYNFYFVPYRLLYRDFPSFVVSQSASSKSATDINAESLVPSTLPYVESSILSSLFKWNVFGYDGSHSYPIYKKNSATSNDYGKTLNFVGLSRMVQAKKLLQYLGYYRITCNKSSDDLLGKNGNTNTRVSLFPLLAYQKVYNDFYRFSQWENEQPWTYNLDYMAGRPSMLIPISKLFSEVGVSSPTGKDVPCFADEIPTMFDMRYVNLTKDSFYGVVPNSQFGAVSTVDTFDFDEFHTNFVYLQAGAGSAKGQTAKFTTDNGRLGFEKSDGSGIAQTGSTLVDYAGHDIFHKYGRFDILSLRAAQAKQKFLEVTLSNNSDYKSQIEAHFNVKVSSLMSGLCDYIGGFSCDLNLDPTTNSNLNNDGVQTNSTNTATYSAIATMTGGGKFSFEAREHGLIIGVTYTLPFIDFNVVGYDFAALRTEFDDFALPEFDRLGFEEVDPRYLTGAIGPGANNYHLGYGPRYYDYKTNYDVCLGDFNVAQNGTQPQFVVAPSTGMPSEFYEDVLTSINKSVLSYGLVADTILNNVGAWSFKCSPKMLNNIFSVQCGIFESADKANWEVHDDTSYDQFYNCLNLNVTVIRNLDRLGLPY